MTETLQTKVCPKCHERKPLSEFYRDAASASGWRSRCKPCHLTDCQLRRGMTETEIARTARGHAAKRFTPEQRFWSRVNKTETCWLWTGASVNYPPYYGLFQPEIGNPRRIGSHRWAYEQLDWTALAACESSGRWHIGGFYSGGVQMDPHFWRTYGGPRFAARPDLATRSEQIRVALNGWRVRGSQPWPTCGHLLTGGTR